MPNVVEQLNDLIIARDAAQAAVGSATNTGEEDLALDELQGVERAINSLLNDVNDALSYSEVSLESSMEADLLSALQDLGSNSAASALADTVNSGGNGSLNSLINGLYSLNIPASGSDDHVEATGDEIIASINALNDLLSSYDGLVLDPATANDIYDLATNGNAGTYDFTAGIVAAASSLADLVSPFAMGGGTTNPDTNTNPDTTTTTTDPDAETRSEDSVNDILAAISDAHAAWSAATDVAGKEAAEADILVQLEALAPLIDNLDTGGKMAVAGALGVRDDVNYSNDQIEVLINQYLEAVGQSTDTISAVDTSDPFADLTTPTPTIAEQIQDLVDEMLGESNRGGFTDKGEELVQLLADNNATLTQDQKDVLEAHMKLILGGDTLTSEILASWSDTDALVDALGLSRGDIVSDSTTTGSANDTPTEGDDLIMGTPDNDMIDGLGGNDIIDAGTGDDIITGGDGNDTLYGNDGNDVIDGGAGDDFVIGNDGNDVIDGGAGDDFVLGNDGNDALTDGTGSDKLYGGNGTDSFTLTFNDGDVDTITDLAAGENVSIAALDGANVTDVQVVDDNGIAVVTITTTDGSYTVNLEGVDAADVTLGDTGSGSIIEIPGYTADSTDGTGNTGNGGNNDSGSTSTTPADSVKDLVDALQTAFDGARDTNNSEAVIQGHKADMQAAVDELREIFKYSDISVDSGLYSELRTLVNEIDTTTDIVRNKVDALQNLFNGIYGKPDAEAELADIASELASWSGSEADVVSPLGELATVLGYDDVIVDATVKADLEAALNTLDANDFADDSIDDLVDDLLSNLGVNSTGNGSNGNGNGSTNLTPAEVIQQAIDTLISPDPNDPNGLNTLTGQEVMEQLGNISDALSQLDSGVGSLDAVLQSDLKSALETLDNVDFTNDTIDTAVDTLIANHFPDLDALATISVALDELMNEDGTVAPIGGIAIKEWLGKLDNALSSLPDGLNSLDASLSQDLEDMLATYDSKDFSDDLIDDAVDALLAQYYPDGTTGGNSPPQNNAELRSLLNDLDNAIDVFNAATNRAEGDAAEADILNILQDLDPILANHADFTNSDKTKLLVTLNNNFADDINFSNDEIEVLINKYNALTGQSTSAVDTADPWATDGTDQGPDMSGLVDALKAAVDAFNDAADKDQGDLAEADILTLLQDLGPFLNDFDNLTTDDKITLIGVVDAVENKNFANDDIEVLANDYMNLMGLNSTAVDASDPWATDTDDSTETGNPGLDALLNALDAAFTAFSDSVDLRDKTAGDRAEDQIKAKLGELSLDGLSDDERASLKDLLNKHDDVNLADNDSEGRVNDLLTTLGETDVSDVNTYDPWIVAQIQDIVALIEQLIDKNGTQAQQDTFDMIVTRLTDLGILEADSENIDFDSIEGGDAADSVFSTAKVAMMNVEESEVQVDSSVSDSVDFTIVEDVTTDVDDGDVI